MAEQTKTGTIDNFRKMALPKPLEYVYKFEKFENKDAAVAANEWPDNVDKSVLDSLNRQKEATAKSVAYQAQLKGLNEAYQDTNEYKRAQFIEGALAGKMALEQATQIADSVPGFQVIPGEVEKMIADYYAKLEKAKLEAKNSKVD